MRALYRKKHVFLGNAPPKSNARAHLKRRQKHSGAGAVQKKHVFWGNTPPKSNARAHPKQRKKHSGLNT